eukprot:scaffold6187_cov168-Ochromonas_danica.AAC.3
MPSMPSMPSFSMDRNHFMQAWQLSNKAGSFQILPNSPNHHNNSNGGNDNNNSTMSIGSIGTSSGSRSIGSHHHGSSSSSSSSIRKEINSLRIRMERLEKTLSSLSSASSSSSSSSTGISKGANTAVGHFMDAISAGTITFNAKTVEICAIIAFFSIGVVMGYSLLDRLWFIGGVLGAWWASGAVHRNTRSGKIARRIGGLLARQVMDLQEKYNQAIIFYRTGKLAYVTSKVWESYDERFLITHKMNEFKRLAMTRAIGFNATSWGLSEQLHDAWQAMLSVPDSAKQWDRKYHISQSIQNAGKDLWQATQGLFDLHDEIVASRSSSSSSIMTRPSTAGSSSPPFFPWLTSSSSSVKTIQKFDPNAHRFYFGKKPIEKTPHTIPEHLKKLSQQFARIATKAVDILLDRDIQNKPPPKTVRWPWSPPPPPPPPRATRLGQKAVALAFLLILVKTARRLSKTIVAPAILKFAF